MTKSKKRIIIPTPDEVPENEALRNLFYLSHFNKSFDPLHLPDQEDRKIYDSEMIMDSSHIYCITLQEFPNLQYSEKKYICFNLISLKKLLKFAEALGIEYGKIAFDTEKPLSMKVKWQDQDLFLTLAPRLDDKDD